MKPKATKVPQVLQMKVGKRDGKLLVALIQNNPTLKQSAILRLALDELAKKQGLRIDVV